MKLEQIAPILERPLLMEKPPEELVDKILSQQTTINQLLEETARLKANASSDSQSSLKPPSSDIHKRSEREKESGMPEPAGKRKPGGQTGYPVQTRKGFGCIDRTEVIRPEECPECGGREFLATPVNVRRPQVAELSSKAIEVLEYEQHCCECQSCGAHAWGQLPPEVIGTQSLGARLQALFVWLGNYGHLSYEKQQELLLELGSIEVGIGTLQATNARLSNVVKGGVEKLGEWVKQSGHVQVDEMSWLVKGVKEWMWVACGVGFCLFHAGDTRSRAELELFLGMSFAGVLISDDFSVYNGYAVSAQQKCLAHLKRHFNKVVKLKHGNNPQLGSVFIDLIDTAFMAHRQWRETQDATAYRDWAEGFKLEVKGALEQWLPNAVYAAGLLLRSLRDKAHQWWYFLDHPAVPPNNNLSERFLRLAVTKRKVCGGSRSMEGFGQTAIVLKVIQTCWTQYRSAFEFFIQALTAFSTADSQSMSSLIPQSST